MRLHLERRTDENLAAGMSHEEAPFAAQRRFGNANQIKELAREQWTWNWLQHLSRELRLTVRRLLRHRIFTATIVVTIGLCVGANLGIFTMLHSVILKPLPFPDADRLVITYNRYAKLGIQHGPSSVPNYFERSDGISAFAEVGAFREGTALIGEAGSAERVTLFQATNSFFRVLQTEPSLGRMFTEEETTSGRANVVMVSDEYWRNQLGADQNVVGKTIRIEGFPATIVGVLPSGFRYLSTTAMLWRPLVFAERERDPRARHSNTLQVIARLKSGATIAQAQAQIDALNDRLSAASPSGDKWATEAGFGTVVAGLQADHVAPVKPALVLLQAAAFLLLVAGTANVTNLLVARAADRTKEIAVRQALGAGLRHVVLQIATETTVLSLAGAFLGLGIAAIGLAAALRLGGAHLPLVGSVAFSAHVVMAAVACSIALGLLLAVPVVALVRQRSLTTSLSGSSRTATSGRSSNAFRHGLIVAQIILVFLLLAGAGLLGLSFKKALDIPSGFQTDNVITAWIGLSWKDYRQASSRTSFVQRWLESMEAIPGVIEAGVGTSLPVVGEFGNVAMNIRGHTPPDGEAMRAHHFAAVAGNYFAALGVPLRQGRFLLPSDATDTAHICVVDQAFAQRYWPGRSALGNQVSLGTEDAGNGAMTIVGVVETVKQNGLTEQDAMGMLYYPIKDNNAPMRLATVMRTGQSPEFVAPAMRQALSQIDPSLALDDVKTMERRVEETLLIPRALMLLGGVFALLALSLAAIGVFGMLVFAVSQRHREIGIRLALGASPSDIVNQFVRLAAKLLVLGLSLGLIGALALGKMMNTLLFEVSPSDWSVLSGTACIVSAVVLIAAAIPAVHASRISPVEALRSE